MSVVVMKGLNVSTEEFGAWLPRYGGSLDGGFLVARRNLRRGVSCRFTGSGLCYA